MKLVTADQMRTIEGRAAAMGLPPSALMETAGLRVAEVTAVVAGGIANRSTLVLVGPGNNGGDGLVAARHLHDWGGRVHLYLWNRRADADPNFDETQRRRIPVVDAAADLDRGKLIARLDECGIVVDALLGTGKARPIEGSLRDVLLRLAGAQRAGKRPVPLVVAVDLPTGLNADTGAVDPVCVRADVTVTLGYPKVGLVTVPGAEHVGRLVAADIGIPDHLADDVRLALATDADVKALLPVRPRWSHKGTFGKALVVAGSRHYVGAAALAAAGAGRVGTGLVTLASPAGIYSSLAARLTEPTFLPLGEDGVLMLDPDALPAVASAVKDYDALLVGPGLGRHPATAGFVRGLLERLSERPSPPAPLPSEGEGPKNGVPPLVLDADALNLLAGIPDWWQGLSDRVVLTPHPGEMARLTGRGIAAVEAHRLELARDAAARWRKVVVLKGPNSIVAAPDGRATVIPIATPALATAGSGDVLAGAIVGFLAQGLAPADAAVAAAFVHGRAGQLLEQELGPAGGLAGDLLWRLPLAMRAIQDTPAAGELVWVT